MAATSFTRLLWRRVDEILSEQDRSLDWLRGKLSHKNKNTLTAWFTKRTGPTRVPELSELAEALGVGLPELLHFPDGTRRSAVEQLELPFSPNSSVAVAEIECTPNALLIRRIAGRIR
jgi:hypothetical protein